MLISGNLQAIKQEAGHDLCLIVAHYFAGTILHGTSVRKLPMDTFKQYVHSIDHTKEHPGM